MFESLCLLLLLAQQASTPRASDAQAAQQTATEQTVVAGAPAKEPEVSKPAQDKRTELNLLGTTESLGKLRGRVMQYEGIPLMVTYHPAALLRNPNWKRPAWEDVQAVRKMHDELLAK